MTDNMPDVHPYLKEDQRRAVSQPADMEKVREALEWSNTLIRMVVKPGACVTRDDEQRSAAQIHDANNAAIVAILDQQKPATPEMTDETIWKIAENNGATWYEPGEQQDGVEFSDADDLLAFARAIIKAVQ